MSESPVSAQELARREREASISVELGSSRWVLTGCVVAYVVALFLPFAGEASGWQLLVPSDAAHAAQAKVTELLFVWSSFLGLALLTSLVVATRRFAIAAPAWMVTTLSLVLALLAIWLRRSSTAFDAGLHHGPGIYLAIAAVAVAVFSYIPVVVRRTPAQRELAEQLRNADQYDDVARAQASAAISRGKSNPLLVDDRRARAAERHRRFQ
ncbi:hypothetical protein CAPI_04730 [Corynebacterium capitovis DSM 44611]|uniref:Rv2732c family membrane protein n=1 Tax=Corynebacterium capitovis TaxID=131081 RepID=UPI000371F6D8|nr:hypothetical protein [Corynebacterium capitovis]WKD57504.1 hypothetical protein CAPI_04730 [Corynebacterium capitovis DSM 44611]